MTFLVVQQEQTQMAVDIQMERDLRWGSKQHLRRSSSADSVFSLPQMSTSLLGTLLLWTTLVLALMMSLSFLFPARYSSLLCKLLTLTMDLTLCTHDRVKDKPDPGKLCISGTAWLCRPLHTNLRMRGLYEKINQVTGAETMDADTLVIYVYSKTDPEYERNLEFFVEHGMWEGDGCDYLIVVQQVWG